MDNDDASRGELIACAGREGQQKPPIAVNFHEATRVHVSHRPGALGGKRVKVARPAIRSGQQL